MARWPVIRHVRYFYHLRRMGVWYAIWHQVGYMGPARSDLNILNAIWRGDL